MHSRGLIETQAICFAMSLRMLVIFRIVEVGNRSEISRGERGRACGLNGFSHLKVGAVRRLAVVSIL